MPWEHSESKHDIEILQLPPEKHIVLLPSGQEVFEEVKTILFLLKESKSSLNNRDLIRAKSNYEKIGKIYNFLSPNEKKAIYPRIFVLSAEIDKEEVVPLIRECMEALRIRHKDTATRIYQKIQQIYSRMPQKYKKKIYEKMQPYVYLFNMNNSKQYR